MDLKSKFLDGRRITPKQSYVTGFREIFYLFVKEEGQLPIFSGEKKEKGRNRILCCKDILQNVIFVLVEKCDLKFVLPLRDRRSDRWNVHREKSISIS